MRPAVNTIPVILMPQTPAEVQALAKNISDLAVTYGPNVATAWGSLTNPQKNAFIQIVYGILALCDSSATDPRTLMNAHAGVHP